MDDFKVVQKSEFEKFINSHNVELVIDVCGIAEPPVKTYNDFTDGKVWPESVVARVRLFGGDKKQYEIKI